MYVDAQTIILAGGLLTAVSAFIALAWKLFKWIDHQKEQDTEIAKIKAQVEKKTEGIQEEQTLVVYGLLACLKGLKEQGCNGPVSEAIDKIEKHINKKAHGT